MFAYFDMTVGWWELMTRTYKEMMDDSLAQSTEGWLAAFVPFVLIMVFRVSAASLRPCVEGRYTSRCD